VTGHSLTRRAVLAAAAAVTGTLAGTMPVVTTAARATTTVRVSDLGFDPADSTPYLQAALDDTTADVVIIDDVGAEWLTGPLRINRDDLVVILEPGVTLRAKPGAFPSTSACLLTIDNHSGISLLGHGATMAMNKPEYTTGEWRHVINLRSASDITVEGLTLRDSGGDGVYAGVSSVAGAAHHCSNITLRNVTATNNRRNGLSVISVDGMLVESSVFQTSSGTSPEAGVDFEPNDAQSRLAGIVMRDCRIDFNATYGLIVSLGNLDATSAPVGLLFERVTVGATSSQIPNLVYYGSGDSAPTGRVEFRDSLIRKSSVAGAVGVFAKAASGPALVFTRTVIWDVGNTVARWLPVTIAAVRGTTTTVTGEYGGVAFSDSLLLADTTGDSLTVDAEPTGTLGLADVTGTLAIANPNGVTTDYGSSPSGVTLMTPAMVSYPSTQVSVAASAATVTAGDPVVITFTRTSSDVQWPLAVVHTSAAGTAVPGVHFDIVSQSVVFAPSAATAQLVIQTRAQAGSTAPVTIRIGIGGGRGYTRLVGSDVAEVVITP